MKRNLLARPIDKVRASRDGHQFHEAWAARKALELVFPKNDLVGIAVEGLAPVDQKHATADAVEIADLTLYYGRWAAFDRAKAVVVAQFKYSNRLKTTPFRASDAKETICKFASAYRTHKRKYGAKKVRDKLQFELITNRPVFAALNKAIKGAASGGPLTGDAKKQASQLETASKLTGKELMEFAGKLRITGLAGSVRRNKRELSRVLADWSIAPDAMARARLGNMRELLSEKVGTAGDGKNVITRTDVLAALELQGPEDLFPCPASFPEIGLVVERAQLAEAAALVPKLSKPLLVHAAGGVGKTVFMQSLSKTLRLTHETVLFDCFGGGAYRAPEDGRHLAKRGLIHIVNNLAAEGLCDPLLPDHNSIEDLIKAFRKRLAQAVNTLRRWSRDAQLLLFIDAIDNAAEHARDTGERAFPTLLLESFHHGGPVNGVQLIVSCRTHRRDISRGSVPCEELELQAFTEGEAEKYLRDRYAKVTNTEVKVAYSRSRGNPRILEHLVQSDRGLLDASELKSEIKLDDLLRARIQKALGEARQRGYKESDIEAFLAGLAVLPPPVPLKEYADAHAMDVTAIESFAADLAPLLEQTKHGLMFRDEPTETLVRDTYAAETASLQAVAANLFKKQGTSVYAATALPGLLQRLHDGELLFKLAFDDRFPAAITSKIGQQNIRYTRLKAAVLHAARKADFNQLVHLLVELSTLAAINERGRDYLLENPNLVIASQDVDATRRLFEIRTRWPGARYARLAIASVLAGDINDAYRHAVNADEWIRHYYRQKQENAWDHARPEKLDIGSIPLCLTAHGRPQDAAGYLKGWDDWYAYELSEPLFAMLDQGQAAQVVKKENFTALLASLKSLLGVLAGALSFLELDPTTCRRLIRELAAACRKGANKALATSGTFQRDREYLLEDGLLKAAAIAVSMKLHAEAMTIVSRRPHERPRVYAYMDRYSVHNASPFLTYAALRAAAQGTAIDEKALLPSELTALGERVLTGLSGAEFRKALKSEIEALFEHEKGLADDKKSMSYEGKRDAERFIDERFEPLLELVRAFAAILASERGKGDKAFQALLTLWSSLRTKRSQYGGEDARSTFFDLLGLQLLKFAFWSRSDLAYASVEDFLFQVTEEGVTNAPTLIDIVAILAKRQPLHELAGKASVTAKTLVDREDDVSHRASLFARLSNAILPASSAEASAYFRTGLERMDTIGSGDYQFTNELLIVAAELRGEELEERDFHTLANICELSMSSDEEKFPWYAFGRGLARTSGCRMLARLGRWHDRSKVSLDYTLLPYLAALLDQEKIPPHVALALLGVSEPAELHTCGTEEIAKIIEGKNYPDAKNLVAELIRQFDRNHPGSSLAKTRQALAGISERVLGTDAEVTARLTLEAKHYEKVQDECNENRNYHGAHHVRVANEAESTEADDLGALRQIVQDTKPTDEAAMSQAVDFFNSRRSFSLKDDFLDVLRAKVRFPERDAYIAIIARLENLNIYAKLAELKTCKMMWAASSMALDDVFMGIGIPLLQIHADDFVSYGYLSGSMLKDVSDLSGVPIPTLTLELIVFFAGPDRHLQASVWMGIAAVICDETEPGQGQAALKRLLNSNAAELSASVVDGAWKSGLYPLGQPGEIAAGLIWLMLGAPIAAERWRAAHSVRCLARFAKWEIVDALVEKLAIIDAHPYQAPEVVFSFLHARLWLLITLERLALDHPDRVAAYSDALWRIAFDRSFPHVLMRHFASRALLACARDGALRLSESDVKALKEINQSPFPRQKKSTQTRNSVYDPRPGSHPKPEPSFWLDYDFDKSDVQRIADTFDRPKWEITDALVARVRKFDPKITSMFESGGRYQSERRRMSGMTAKHHTYGQQLGWHALFLVAGECLAKYPVVNRYYSSDEDYWLEWLEREVLTREDGLWISDGIDRSPVETQVNLQEKGDKGLVLTSSQEKVLALLGISTTMTGPVTVAGDWLSLDGVNIHVTSALAPRRKAGALALQLASEGFQAWMPAIEEYADGSETSRNEKPPFKSWVVTPSRSGRLDDTDPLAADSVLRRQHLTAQVNALGGLQPTDVFKRAWVNPSGAVAVRGEAWGKNSANDESVGDSGNRLTISAEFLRRVLEAQRLDLLILVILRRTEKTGYGSSRETQYWHTTGVLHVMQSLEFEFLSGSQNTLQVLKW